MIVIVRHCTLLLLCHSHIGSMFITQRDTPVRPIRCMHTSAFQLLRHCAHLTLSLTQAPRRTGAPPHSCTSGPRQRPITLVMEVPPSLPHCPSTSHGVSDPTASHVCDNGRHHGGQSPSPCPHVLFISITIASDTMTLHSYGLCCGNKAGENAYGESLPAQC